MKFPLFISFAFLVSCTTYGDPSLLGGVKSQWRADDKVVVVANVNVATAITKGSTYTTEMSLYRAAEEANNKGFDYFYAVNSVDEQLAMEMNGDLPIPAEKGMKPVAASHSSGYRNTVFVMSQNDTVAGKVVFAVENVLGKYQEEFGS